MASFDGKVLILTAILIYCIGTMGIWTGKRSTCSGRGRINGKGNCDCQERFVGTTCGLCQFGRYGGGCYFGSPVKGRLVEKIHAVIIVAPQTPDYERTRLQELSSELQNHLYVSSCSVIQYPQSKNIQSRESNPDEDILGSANYVIVADYSDGIASLLERHKQNLPDVVVITWILSNAVNLELWKELRPNAHTSPSEGLLKNIGGGKLEPVRVIPEPALECKAKGSSEKDNISIQHDFDVDVKTVGDEMSGFGRVRYEGSGWGVNNQIHVPDLRTSFSTTQLVFLPQSFSDVVPVTAFDAASCGALYIPLPAEPHAPLRHLVPTAIFPENLLDLRIQIQSLLQHPNRIIAITEEFATSTNIANTLKEVTSQLVNTYEVLLP